MADTDKLNTLKKMLGIADDDKSGLADFSLNNAEEIVMNYCNIEKVPDGLNSTVIRMAMDIYRNEGLGSSDAPQSISSITRGDVSTSFGTLSAEYTVGLLKDYKKTLNRFRKVGF